MRKTCITGKLPPPVGTSEWEVFSQDSFCVDKTRMIKELVDLKTRVALFTRPYWVQRVPLTFEQWAEFASPLELTEIEEALGGKRGSLGRVSMREVLTACEKLTARFRDQLPSGYVIRLPTEAEFGHACAAGSVAGPDLLKEWKSRNGKSRRVYRK